MIKRTLSDVRRHRDRSRGDSQATKETNTPITVELTKNIEQSPAKDWPDRPRRALEGYRQEALSQGQVGEMLALNFWENEAFLKERQAYLHYDEQYLQNDLRTLETLELPRKREDTKAR